MAASGFRIPSSSAEELRKIVCGYTHLGENVELPALARLLSLNKTVLSPNNPFLVEAGIITAGKKKSVTAVGQRLGRAWEHEQTEEARDVLRQIVGKNENLTNLITTLRLKGGMSTDDFSKHTLYAASLPSNARNRTGTRTIIDLFVEAGLVNELDGRLEIAKSTADGSREAIPKTEAKPKPEKPAESDVPPPQPSAESEIPKILVPTAPVVSINIELKIPATDNADVYDNFFKAMKKHLWPDESKVE